MITITKPKIGERVYDSAVGSAGFLYEAHDFMRHDDLSANELDTLQSCTFKHKLDALTELKQSILQKASSGELTNGELAA